jgi:hypothetical protein
VDWTPFALLTLNIAQFREDFYATILANASASAISVARSAVIPRAIFVAFFAYA